MGQFGNYQNEKKKKTINTNSIQFYNKDAKATLITGFWEGTLTLKICPTLPDNKQTKTSVYDYETFVNAALTHEKLYDLSQALNVVKASVAEGIYTFEPMGVPAGAGYVEIGPASVYGIDIDGIAMTIYNGIGADGKAENKFTYLFNKSNYFKNYANGGGEYSKSDLYEAEFNRFVIVINESIKALTNAVAHTVRTTNMYTNDSIIKSLAALKEKAGVEVSDYSGGYKKNYSSNVSTYMGVNKMESSKPDDTYIKFGGVVVEDRLPLEM